MTTQRTILFIVSLLAFGAVSAKGDPAQDGNHLPASYVPPGAEIYKQYCAACHGADAKGDGPVTREFKKPAPDLTTLAKRHGGKFPYEYFTGVLRFGPGVPSHGSGAMPTWGPLFEYYYNRSAALQRIRNLRDYLVALQAK